MGIISCHSFTAAILILLFFVCNVVNAQNVSTLAIRGIPVVGGTFSLVCSTEAYSLGLFSATFYRSSTPGLPGTNIGEVIFSPSCEVFNTTSMPYPYGCEDEGRTIYINITVSTDIFNITEHNQYWRCATNLYPADTVNEVYVSIIAPIERVSLTSPSLVEDSIANVTENATIQFRCVTTYGRPAANITWFLDNLPLVDETITTTMDNGFADLLLTSSNLTLRVNRTTDGKAISCRGRNYVNMDPIESFERLTLRVKYPPPGPPVLDGYDDGPLYIYRAVIGVPQTMVCQVPTAYPVPELSWSCSSSVTVTGTTPLPGSTDVVSSRITWTATSTEPGQTCQCTSYQELTGNVTANITITVLYPPVAPTYTLNVSGVATDVSDSIDVIQGDTVKLTCDTVSNPPPTTDQYMWSNGGRRIQNGQELILNTVDISDENNYTCEVTNFMNATDGTSSIGRNSSQIEIHVLYPPMSMELTYRCKTNPVSISIHTTSNPVTCRSDGNPAPSVQWTGGELSTTNGTLSLYNVRDSGNYTCTASNTMVRRPGVTTMGSNSTTLAVELLYGPTIDQIPRQEVVEGSQLRLSCSANSNPVSSYFWSRPNSTNRNIDGPVLSIASIRRSEVGTYTCYASNSMLPSCERHNITGEALHSVSVVVQYFPILNGTDKSVTENTTTTLSCTADGVPADYTFNTWIHVAPDNVTVLRTLTGVTNGAKTTLRLSAVDFQDTGLYRCSVSNGVHHYLTGNRIAVTEIEFTVKSRPVVTTTVDGSGQKGGNTTLYVNFYSNDVKQPSVVWYQGRDDQTRNISGQRANSYVSNTEVDVPTYSRYTIRQPGFTAALVVKDIQESDFTDYTCYVTNTVGTISVSMSLRPKGRPDQPAIVDIIQEGSNITLYWKSGFHGGSNQIFHILWRKADENDFNNSIAVFGGLYNRHMFNVTLPGFSPGTNYVFSLVASNTYGTSEGVMKPFMTATTTEDSSSSVVGPAVAGAFAGLLAVAIVLLLLFVIKRHGYEISRYFPPWKWWKARTPNNSNSAPGADAAYEGPYEDLHRPPQDTMMYDILDRSQERVDTQNTPTRDASRRSEYTYEDVFRQPPTTRLYENVKDVAKTETAYVNIGLHPPR